MNKEAKLKLQRETRKRTGDASTKKYEKTISGFLMRSYRNMQSRTQGLVKPHLYKGLSLLPRSDFYRFSRASSEFQGLYRQWIASGYDRKQSPSVNRVDNKKGYDLENIEWMTHSVNSMLGARTRAMTSAQRQCIERMVTNAS